MQAFGPYFLHFKPDTSAKTCFMIGSERISIRKTSPINENKKLGAQEGHRVVINNKLYTAIE